MNNAFPTQLGRQRYPIEAFLSIAREAGLELDHEGLFPDSLIGVCLIGAMSLSSQGLVDVKMPTGKICPPVQYIIGVAESGFGKSTLYSLMYGAFLEADAQAIVDYQLKMERYQTDVALWQAKNSGILRAISKATSKGEETTGLDAQLAEHAKLKPKVPILHTFLHGDMTPKAVVEALKGDGISISVATDEGHMLFSIPVMSQFGLLNRLYDSPEVLSMDRAGHEQTLARKPRASVFILTQSEPLRAHLSKHGSLARDSGFIARCLIAWPRPMPGFRQIRRNEPVRQLLEKFKARTRELADKYKLMIESGNVEREIVEFSDDAKARWFDYAVQTENMMRQGQYLNDISDFASKVMEILARLAATMHYFSGESGKVTLDTLERAFTIVRWHIDEFKLLFSPQYSPPQDQSDMLAVVAYLRSRVWYGPNSDSIIPKNRLLRYGPVRTRDRLDAALDLLIVQGGVQLIRGLSPKDTTKYVRLMNAYFVNVNI